MLPDLTMPRWLPAVGHRLLGPPEPGQLVAWRYAAWRVLEVRPFADIDLRPEDIQALAGLPPEVRERRRPYAVVLRHARGPLPEGWPIRHDNDGFPIVHVAIRNIYSGAFHELPERYPVCSCHGHPWPCLAQRRDDQAKAAAREMERQLATTQPGVCAACLGPISSRQKTVTFPEPSLIVPGAPGPTFHAGRLECWWAAVRYETEKRLKAHPEATRLVSCPGVGFIHENGGRFECSAGPACTGHHGPVGGRVKGRNCFTHVFTGFVEDSARPLTDCGFRHGNMACLGSDR